MTTRASDGLWVADLLDEEDFGTIERGEHWSSTGGDDSYPDVVHPIGFDLGHSKPRVRVKAWTRPIL